MTPHPIRKVLSSMRTNGVQCLLMGGQACVLYGGAEFSRDTDLAILLDADNLRRLRNTVNELQAETIAVPPFEQQYLEMGLAVHFRCRHPEAAGMRIDVMSKMRSVADFRMLWQRRTTLEVQGDTIELLSLPDLVLSKKTQRDKDWPMIKRLVEANYFSCRDDATEQRIAFWLSELRTEELLRQVVSEFPAQAKAAFAARPLLTLVETDPTQLGSALQHEELSEKEKDRAYWAPLRSELERLRAARP